MTYQPSTFEDDEITLENLPGWITSGRGETVEDMAFLSGAALSHLHLVLSQPAVPQALLRARLALMAAETCVAHIGRVERAGELRDALAFLQPGDHPGPSGEIYRLWSRMVETKFSHRALLRALPNVEPDRIRTWLDTQAWEGPAQRTAVGRASGVLGSVHKDDPRMHATALLLADASVSRSLGWAHIVPLLSLTFRRGDLGKTGEDLRMACHKAVVAGVIAAMRVAADLSRRATRLHEVTPKLRAKGAKDAVTLFLSQDAVAPTMLLSLRSDRGRRRFCDRLVDLGAVRELTGRETFRLYGL